MTRYLFLAYENFSSVYCQRLEGFAHLNKTKAVKYNTHICMCAKTHQAFNKESKEEEEVVVETVEKEYHKTHIYTANGISLKHSCQHKIITYTINSTYIRTYLFYFILFFCFFFSF